MGGEWNDDPFTQIRADGKRYPPGEGPDVNAPTPEFIQFLISIGVDVPNLLTSITTSVQAPWPPLNRLLDTVGDGSGVTNAVGDYSGAAETFLVAPPAATIYEITQLQVEIETALGGPSIRPGRYGDIPGGLTNGVDIHSHNGVSVIEQITEVNIEDNRDWIRNAYQVSTETDQNTGFMHVLWDFGDAAIRIDGDLTQELRVVLEDDLTALVGHTFTVKGSIIT